MSDPEIATKLQTILASAELDGLILAEPHNVRYATGIWLPTMHAQADLPVLAIVRRGRPSVAVLPEALVSSAEESVERTRLNGYGLNRPPLESALASVAPLLGAKTRIGVDMADTSHDRSRAIAATLARKGCALVDCSADIRAARSVKTQDEVLRLSDIALRTDHGINGYFHHLIANRPSSALVISEGIRIHCLERDIELSGYAACARATVGADTKKFWAYAPNYDYASASIRKRPHDLLVAEAANPADGYWSNSVRIAINAKHMTDAQEKAFDDLNRMRGAIMAAMRVGTPLNEVFAAATAFARTEGIAVPDALGMGFGIGIGPMEAPFLTPGETAVLETGMVLILDPVVISDGHIYRSRDTVVMRVDGPEIVNWYKDWREPYMAIGNLADFG